MIDVSYWRQAGSVTAHLVNLTNPMAMGGYIREILPAGPYEVSLQLPPGSAVKRVRLLEADRVVTARRSRGTRSRRGRSRLSGDASRAKWDGRIAHS
jgi:hypothetical protein